MKIFLTDASHCLDGGIVNTELAKQPENMEAEASNAVSEAVLGAWQRLTHHKMMQSKGNDNWSGDHSQYSDNWSDWGSDHTVHADY